MNKGYYSRFFYLLVLLPISLLIPSCTYDYFDDETNYEVYVPKADKNLRTETYSIEDLSIFIYNEELVRQKHSFNPFSENARHMSGNFNFRLFPGNYSVYCFTNAQEANFQDLNTYNTARFDLQQFTDGTYKEPSAIYVEHKTPTIHFPGPVVSDTALFEHKYVGRICIAFKNLTKLDPSFTYSNIKKIDIEASGVGVTQYLHAITDIADTRSSRNSETDMMRLSAETFQIEYKDFEFGAQNYYFPSPDLSAEGNQLEPITLNTRFIDQSGAPLLSLIIHITDANGTPIVLHMNETLIVEVDGNKVKVLRLNDPEEWNPQIEEEPNSGPGGGGLEV